MQIHQLKRKTKNKKKKLVGRGGTRGKTSGRGTKGQNARAGRKKRPELRDIIKKLPKQRGYKFASRTIKPQVVNISALEANFDAGTTITRVLLLENRLVKKSNGTLPYVKILGTGEVTKKFILSGLSVSAGAKEKIEKAGGSVA